MDLPITQIKNTTESKTNVNLPTLNCARNRKNKKKKKNKNKKQAGTHKKQISLTRYHKPNFAMTSWAEAYTKAATWQCKHQIAYWKAKAIALEHENRILHDIIRKNNVEAIGGTNVENCDIPMSENTGDSSDQCNEYLEENISDTPAENYAEYYQDDSNDEFEVSEAFIDFLQANAKYKEDARREREKFKSAGVEVSNDIEEPRCSEDREKELKSLYGSRWRKISALETSLSCQFMSESDQNKPTYWPNIPFNFG